LRCRTYQGQFDFHLVGSLFEEFASPEIEIASPDDELTANDQ